MLTANNPAAAKNIARFNMKERCYKFEPMVEQTIVHYATDGWLLHKGSEEARKQMDMEKMEQEAAARFQAEMDKAQAHGDKDGEADGPDDSKQLRNQFNFSERAAQTVYYALRDRETYTEPPPTVTISGRFLRASPPAGRYFCTTRASDCLALHHACRLVHTVGDLRRVHQGPGATEDRRDSQVQGWQEAGRQRSSSRGAASPGGCTEERRACQPSQEPRHVALRQDHGPHGQPEHV